MSDVKEFTIDRSIWLRATIEKPVTMGAVGSYLLREQDQKRCCLGIYLQACGVDDPAMEGAGSPSYLYRHTPRARKLIPSWLISTFPLVDGNSIVADILMSVNDDDTTSDAQKEERIVDLFKEQGIKVTFV